MALPFSINAYDLVSRETRKFIMRQTPRRLQRDRATLTASSVRRASTLTVFT